MTSKLPARKAPRSLDETVAEVVHDPASMEIVFVAERRVSCMGAGGALGHPKVFYTIGEKGYAECGYCDRVFYYDPSRAGETLTG